MEAKSTGEGLKRVIGIPALAATIVNAIIGAGIYVLPAIVSIRMGASGILAYLFCGVMLIAIILCYMEIGSKVNASGGSYVYIEKAFGPFAGFVANWLYSLGWGILGSAALMNVIADSFAVLFPVFSNPFMRALLYFILLGAMVWINVRGAKQSVKVLEYITIIKLIPLFGIIIFGFSQVKMDNLHWQHWPHLNTLGETVLVLFFAFAGFETALGASGEIKNPKRTIPFGVLLGAAIVFLFYVLIQTVTQGVFGSAISAFKDAPLAAVAQNIVGPAGTTVLLVAAMISCLGNVGGDVLNTPRLLFAGANDGLFPRFLTKVHPRFATPYLAVITYAGLIFLFSVSGGFKDLAVLASGALLLIYLGVILSTVRLRLKKGPAAEKTFRAPGGLSIPLIGIVAIIWLLSHLSAREIVSTIVFIVIICLIFFLMKIFQRKKVSVTPTVPIQQAEE
jgi:basic amino acid/polyamine antiporter, APA family